MNLQQINEFRIAHGLTPLTGDPRKKDAKKRQAANQAERAAECKRIRDTRNSNRK